MGKRVSRFKVSIFDILKIQYRKILYVLKDNASLYDFGKKFENVFLFVGLRFLFFLSPTWFYAYTVKYGLNKVDRMKGIVARNYTYLTLSLVLTFVFGMSLKEVRSNSSETLTVLLCLFLYSVQWSRCNEILISFISDALDKSTDKPNQSTLTYRKRIELALLSYCELILNYSLIYLLMPKSWFTNNGFDSVIDSIYFSGVTITTLGYGDISPQEWLPKLIVIHQVLAGFTLIVVSFALYVGRSSPDR